jgi:5-methyltetrahydropteroyltriglutamate--homocysteine methyltransferase
MAKAPHNPPFRAEHIGSLLRPDSIKEARDRHEAGEISDTDLNAIEDQAIREVVTLQEDLGLEVITDGEFRRSTYSEFFTTTGLDGVAAEYVGGGDWEYVDASGDRQPARVPTVHGKIKWSGPTNIAAFTFLKGITKKTPKLTMPGPCYIHYRAGRANISKDVYPDLDDFWSDLIAAYHKELEALAAVGCTYIQLDETSIPKLADPKIQNALKIRGDNWQQLLSVYADVINAVIDGAPKEIHFGMHLCRGNKRGHWQAEGGYDQVADMTFRKLHIPFYFLEYDSDRAGSFEPLATVPDDKCVVLGLFSTKSGTIEDKDAIKARIKEASKFIDLDRLCVSPQCGFSSSVHGVTTPDQQKAKLSRVIEVAQEVWG